MTDDINRTPDDPNQTPDDSNQPPQDTPDTPGGPDLTIEHNEIPPQDDNNDDEGTPQEDGMAERVERLGGEPAPAISPEEFARLQKSGQIHIDARGRVRTNRREETDAGMSLRKRRAWYRGTPHHAW